MKEVPRVALVIWVALVLSIGGSAVVGQWQATFVSTLTLVLSVLPIVFANRFEVKLPTRFAAAIVVFVFASLFLGEVKDFYERFWWWDMLLHASSAIAFGLLGFVVVFMLFEGDRFAAPPIALATLSFCFAVTIGTVWEIFEFTVDQSVGLNMQKSGLVDTMRDLILDCAGAVVSAATGYVYLLRRGGRGFLLSWIAVFVEKNRKRYRKLN